MTPPVIIPTIGRQVWYWRDGADRETEQAQAATVCYVHNEREVNLQVIDRYGHASSKQEVRLRQPEDAAPMHGSYCEWMPFQVGQAKQQAPADTR